MALSKKQRLILKWVARIYASIIILFGLPFYFGYGNPLPFINPDYGLWDNVWLTVFPLMFIGLGLGWLFETAGGLLTAVSVISGLVLGLFIEGELVPFMIVPLSAGILYVISGVIGGKRKEK